MSLCNTPNCLVSAIAPLWIQMLQAIQKHRGIKGDYEEKETLHCMRTNMESYAVKLRKKEEDMQSKVDALVADAKARMAAKDRFVFFIRPCVAPACTPVTVSYQALRRACMYP